MVLSPVARQFLVAGSTHLAALSAGGVIAYPSVLLEQLKANDTIIQLDLHKGSWIGSVHGMAGIPSMLMPFIMQYRGRRFAFIFSCVLIIVGWIFTYIAQNISTLIIGECFHGLGTNSLIAVSFLSVSEMLQPSYRNTSLLLYGTIQALGISSVGIIGRYLHWKTVGLIMCSPALMATLLGCLWPESPSWLAYKGRFKECEQSFVRLRGTDEESKKELKALINSQKEELKIKSVTKLQDLKHTITSRDFCLPAFHTFVLINVTYWGGGMPVIIYSNDMIMKISGAFNAKAKLTMDILLFVGYNIASVIVHYCSSKKTMLFSMTGSAVFMGGATVTTYLERVGVLSKEPELAVYCLVGFIAFLSLGSSCIGFSIASEIMPVKHRGVGGCLYILYTYVPDTRNRTLKEIEDFYTLGHFKALDKNDAVDVPFIKSEID
uniref:Major facilitator superfamily (MFS) profile domain-containing protein n=1 Tax=Heliothis virescens TaxID=7102 RepID=A0A2A4JN29_HELVI